MKSSSSPNLRKLIGPCLQLIALVALTVWIGISLYKGFSVTQPYGETVRAPTLVNYAIILLGALVYFRYRKRSRLLTAGLWLVTGLVWTTLISFVIGGAQNWLQGSCAGFFGAQQNCIDNWSLAVSLALFHPFVFIPLAAIIPALLLLGSWKTIRGK